MKSTLASIGELRHRITFQVLTLVKDGQGGSTNVWTNIVATPTVWAKVEPVSSRETVFAQQLQYRRTHKVKIRYRSDLNTSMRFIFENRIFQIKGTIKPDERKVYVFIDAEENVAT